MCRGVGGRAADGSGEGSKARPIFGSAENAKIVSSYPLGGSRPGIFYCKPLQAKLLGLEKVGWGEARRNRKGRKFRVGRTAVCG